MSAQLPFVHLGARSDVSLGDSIATVTELCWEAARDEQGFLGLTDVNSLANAPSFAVAAARAGLRPLFGAELNMLPFGESQFRGATHRLRVLVENERGWQTLVRLVNVARRGETSTRPPHLAWSTLLEDPRGLLLFPGGDRGELAALLRDQHYERIEQMVRAMLETADAANIFLELPPSMLASATTDSMPHLTALTGIAKYFGLGIVYIPTVRCAHATDDVVLRFFEGVRTTEGRPPSYPRDLVRPIEAREHLLTRQQAIERSMGFPHGAATTLAVAERCSSFSLPHQDRRFPVHDFNRGVDAESFIWNTAFSRATERYGDLPTRYKERLNREFREIVEAGLANAIVSLVRLNEELESRGVQRGPGAGLFTNSVIASLLGLTRLDPLKFDLPFELPPGLAAGSFPLLELPIPANQEEEAVAALHKLFDGQVVNVGEWRPWKHTAVMEWIAELLGKDGKWAGVMHRLPAFMRAREASAHQPATYLPPMDIPIESMEVLAWFSHRMEGRARELVMKRGEYAFTVEQIDGSIPRRIPEGVSGASGKRPLPASEWSGEVLGRLRFGRVAFVHPPLLDLVGESTALAREQGDNVYSPEHTAPDDGATYRLLCDGHTAGIEPLESPLIRRRLRQGQPGDLHALIRLLNNPGKAGDEQDVIDLSTLLLCHVCAAIKAHRPHAFLAAALGQAMGDERRTAVLLEEVRDRGIPMAGIDINYSAWRWTLERDTIRPGFSAVRALNPTAAAEITTKRREMHFGDLAEFCERTERAKLKPQQIRALVKAGAFDQIAPSRSEALRRLNEMYPSNSSRRGNGALGEGEPSFFDRDTQWRIRQFGASIPADATGGDNASVLAAQQIEACGFLAQRAPLAGEEQFLRGAQVKATDQLTLKMTGLAVTIEGVIGPVVQLPGNPGHCIADVRNVSAHLTAEPARLALSNAFGTRRTLLTGVLGRDAFQWTLQVQSMIALDDAMERARTAGRLVLDLAGADENAMKILLQLLKRYPGRTPVAMEWLPLKGPRAFHSVASRCVLVCPLLERGLGELLDRSQWRIEPVDDTPRRSDELILMGRRFSLGALRRFLPLAGGLRLS